MAPDSNVNPLSGNRGEEAPQTNVAHLPITRGIAGDLRRWSIFLPLEQDFLKSVRLCCVFGSEGAQALFITKNDEVWAVGSNKFGGLGTGSIDPCPTPVKIAALSGKDVRSFAYGDYHTLALTGRGEVYGWGVNIHALLGRVPSDVMYTPTLVYKSRDPVLEIACGANHSAFRTRGGRVYCWGYNGNGQTGIDNQSRHPVPLKVENLNESLQCSGISCTRFSTVAVFESGEVYAWGRNGSDETGMEPSADKAAPVKVDLKDAVIQKVACGDRHTLALADDGSLYVWGDNDYDQLGLNHEIDQPIPVCHSDLRDTHGRVIEIAASGHTSAVTTERSTVLMWGRCRVGQVKKPTEVLCESVQDVFATFSEISVTPVPLIVRSTYFESSTGSSTTEWGGNFLNAIAKRFNDPSFSDVAFIVESQRIHVHTALLKFQSEYFRRELQGTWKEEIGGTIELGDASYPVYNAFLKYFYTGEVDLPLDEVPELLRLADECSENGLKMLCQKRIENMISIENCTSVYSAALRCRAKDVEDFCFRFVVENFRAVLRTGFLAALSDDIFNKLLAEAAEQVASES